MSEYLDLIKEFPRISVEVTPPNPLHEAVLLIEAQNVRADNYKAEQLVRYKHIYTWNSKFAAALSQHIPTTIINGFPLFDNYFWLEDFIPIERKIDGICLIARASKRDVVGDISHSRELVFNEIKGMTKHAYGKIPFCGEYYRGVIGDKEKDTFPSSLAKLKKLNEYKFSLCFENCYHEVWSWDYITEKIFDCFKAKTIPVYLGCYNIESHIPSEFFIDFRKFNSTNDLVAFLRSLTNEQIQLMTDNAYQWVQKSQWGSIAELKKQLSKHR